jgi:DNA-directed DNA polymerase III PolC
MAYAELHCVSNFSFLRGASRPEELIARAAALGYTALAITDECSVAGVVRAHTACKEMHEAAAASGQPVPRLIVGTELRLVCGTRLIVLAVDRSGYGQICRLITRGRRAADKGQYRLERADVQTLLQPGCVLLLWLPPRNEAEAAPESAGQWLAGWAPEACWIAVELLRDGHDRAHLAACEALAQRVRLPLVAAGDVHMHVRARRRLQDALTAIRHNVPLTEAGLALLPNGERYLREPARLAKLYPSALLAATLAIAARCRFSLDELRYEYPREIVPEGHTPTSWLRALVEEGARRRWSSRAAADVMPPAVRALVEYELTLIADLQYEPYFLTVQDIVAFARSQGILCQGRGSAANSAVCYCLGVTEVDPSRMSMLVERFISRERNEPPDIDVDFEHERREEVIQYVYRKYGRERAALTATVICYRPRSALRDLGKALGLDTVQTERLAGAMQWWDGSVIEDARVREAGFDPASPVLANLLGLARELMGFPRHLSQHVGGFVIARDLLEELVPIENAAMPERTVIQWDKDDLDDLKLLKVDLLGLGMLAALRRALDLVSGYRAPLTMADIPSEDPATYEMISRADTVGVFQIESRAQMAMLPRLRPRNYYDLVIEVALVRPGPIQGDMVHPYLRRRNGEEQVSYPSPEVASVLQRTLGVPIFQEQVMQLAIVAAGFTPGEADKLRRAMAAWKRRGGLGHFEQRLIDGMGARGYNERFARQIFQQILGFGEYGFPECVVGSTRVVDAETGRWVTIDDVVAGHAGLRRTLACDDALQLEPRAVEVVRASGVKPVYRLCTALGHEIVATAEHPFFTPSGWRKLGELRTGSCVAAARRVAVEGSRRWVRHRIQVLADLLAARDLRDSRGHLPDEVFELRQSDIALLIARLWDSEAGGFRSRHATYDTASLQLARELQHLLLRLGIVARLDRRRRRWRSRFVHRHSLTVTGYEPLSRFWSVVGRLLIDPRKRARCRQLATTRPPAAVAASDIYWDRVVSIGAEGDAPTFDLQIAHDHNFLAENLVVHNSHAASFALLVYVSAWLKCHEPAAFCCALLNSQPMGFYAPSQLVRDARAHGVEVRPVDVNRSDVDCSLETQGTEKPALRLGLRLAKSLSATGAARVVAARPFGDVQDLTARAGLDRGDLEALAAAGALASLTGNRHQAFWSVAGTERELPLAPRGDREEATPMLPVPSEGQDIVADYRAVGLTLGRHPVALLRPQLDRERMKRAADLVRIDTGRFVRLAGIVVTRQRPSSASGVTFVTLEDETGHVNLVVWERVGQAQRRALIESRLMEVRGVLQREGIVTHVIAHRLVDRSALLGGLMPASRDFH